MQQLVEEGAAHLKQSAPATLVTYLQAAPHIPLVLAAHMSLVRSALVATTLHIEGMATSSLAHMQHMVEKALVVAASQFPATAPLRSGLHWLPASWTAMELLPHALPTPNVALFTSLAMEEMLTLQETSKASPHSYDLSLWPPSGLCLPQLAPALLPTSWWHLAP